MIKAIFFDFDGVLTLNASGSRNTCKNLADTTGIDADKLYECHHKWSKELLTGKESYKDIWEQFCACLEKDLDISILNSAFRKTPRNDRMFDIVKKLKGKYKVGIITDNSKERLTACAEELQLKDYFDSIIVSAEVGSIKTEAKIFNTALASLNLQPEEAVFIDNTEKNLIIPKELGIKTIFHDDKKNDIEGLKEQLQQLGVDL